MKKKILISLLALALALSVTACSGTKKDSATKTEQTGQQTTAAENSPETDDTTTILTPMPETIKGNPIQVSESCDATLHRVTGFEVKAVSYRTEKGAHILKFKVENSSGVNYKLSFSRVLVNGVYINAAAEIYSPSGTPATKELIITSAMLEDPGIALVSEIETTLEISATETGKTIVTKDLRFVTPSYNNDIFVKKDGTTVINNNVVKLTVTNTKKDAAGGIKLTFCYENNSSNPLNFEIKDVKAADKELDVKYSRMVPAGVCTFGSFSINAKELEANGISADKLNSIFVSAAIGNISGTPFTAEDVEITIA